MIIRRGTKSWERRVHAFQVCAQCGTLQGRYFYGYDPIPDVGPDSPICHRFAFCNIRCHNLWWAKRDPARVIPRK